MKMFESQCQQVLAALQLLCLHYAFSVDLFPSHLLPQPLCIYQHSPGFNMKDNMRTLLQFYYMDGVLNLAGGH